MRQAGIIFTRERLFSGYDGKTCKGTPKLAYDGEQTMYLGYNTMSRFGSDVFLHEYVAKSTDGGKTFGEPEINDVAKDIWEDGIRIHYSATLRYNKGHKKWFGIGRTTTYLDDKRPVGVVEGEGHVGPPWMPIYWFVDQESQTFLTWKEIPFPFEYAVATPYHILELENGDLLIAYYFRASRKSLISEIMTVRYAMEEDGLRMVSYGEPLKVSGYARGIHEPCVTYFDGKYYMTIRNDEMGLFAESEDGLRFSEPKPWVWEDGTLLENYNTQQHWVRNEKGLFLVYTRRTEYNDHVFRNRAPLFMTRFDEERKCLIRDQEVVLVPELGAQLGNFTVLEISEKESWVSTTEIMTGVGCEKYGGDNSIWIAKVYSK